MADDSPVGSPLSDLSSDAFDGEEEHALMAEAPPAKRQKLGDSSMRATPIPHIDADADALSISTDTSGDIPNSPTRPDDDDTHEQVTVCSWLGCDAGDLGDMDKLVEHIHNEHIEAKTKTNKYLCEWSSCTRRSMPHASGYALKAHMRSHTREKPFYCALPECDRAFTRSDALAKHMRTVHETEALRPSDPIPKSMHSLKASRLKLLVKNPQPTVEGSTHTNGNINGNESPGWTSSYPEELGFTAEEESRGPQALYRLLKRQIPWAEAEGESLRKQCEAMEKIRRQEWNEKETLLDQVINNEADWHQRRQEVLAGMARNIPTLEAVKAAAARLSPQGSPPTLISEGQGQARPEEEKDAVDSLASMHDV